MPAYGHINLLRQHWINEEAANFCPRFPGRCFLLPSNPFWEKRSIECDNIVYMICDFTMLCYVSTNFWCTKNCRKKHDIAPRTAEKKHDMVHEKRQTRARARRNKQNMSWVSWVLQEMPNNIYNSFLCQMVL